MAWFPISNLVPQYVDPDTNAPHSGAVLKAYDVGTTDNVPFATDNTGDTTVNSVALNASGHPEVSGNVIIPHLDRDYKLALYPDQTAADADSGALWTVDDIDLIEDRSLVTSVELYSDLKGLDPDDFSDGDAIYVRGSASVGDGLEGHFKWTSGDQSTNVTNDPNEIIWVAPNSDTDGSSGAWRRLGLNDVVDPEHATDSATDTYVSATNTTPPADGVQIVRDFQSANTTTTPTLDGKTMTTRDGSALWAGAVSGPHELQYDLTADTYLVLEPRWQLAPFWAGHIDGLELSNGTDAAHDIDVATGVCSMRDGSGNRKLFNLTSGLTKQIDANWAEGSAAGGFPSGLTLSADTWYRVFLIGKDDGTVDAGFDTDASATNLLADATSYSWFRHVRWVVTDGSSNILPTIQDGDFVWHDVTVNDRDGSNPGTAAILITTTAPPDTKAVVNYKVIDNSPAAATSVLVTSPYQTDTAPTSNLASFSVAVSASDEGVSWEGVVKTNASSQIRVRFSNSDAAIIDNFNTVGWIDDRGRNA